MADGLRPLDAARAVRELAPGAPQEDETPASADEVSEHVRMAKENLARVNAERESERMRVEARHREEEAEMRKAEAELAEMRRRREESGNG